MERGAINRERRKAIKGKTPQDITAEWGLDHSKYKTEMCKNWIEIGSCRYGTKCQFAHGKYEVASQSFPPTFAIGAGGSNKYKSQDCVSFTECLVCPYGSRCLFRHESRTLEQIHERVYAARLCQIS